jgi:hypothetical protein
MTNLRITPDGLPVVTEGTFYSLMRDMDTGSFSVSEAYQRIEKENPHAAMIISTFAVKFQEKYGEEAAVGLLNLSKKSVSF